MGKIYENILELVGNTPMVHLNKIEEHERTAAHLYAKVEGFNPAGSVKDRAALHMIEAAEQEGKLKPGAVIVEGTSGNTGIGLAMVSAVKGYRAIICMAQGAGREKIKLLKAYGAEVELTPKKNGFGGGGSRAQEIEESHPGAFRPAQGENPHHPETHYLTTGPEIWNALNGKVDIFVATVGTSGTSGGISKFLKEKNPDVEIYGVEPAGCPVLNGGEPGPHKIQGIGGGAICPITDLSLYKKILLCTDEDAYKYARLCPKKEGLLIGISAGAALWAAVKIGRMPENKDKNIVVLFPDGGGKYLSSDLFDE
ncbi:MAG: cysteine synthase A [Bacillus sp. (in: Bacteria)]|nr:cysteine synthase A [Bacillus sp. (in: firmicutes)]MCM1427747.1 cysteine synthase A [Eubacterium sp.]